MTEKEYNDKYKKFIYIKYGLPEGYELVRDFDGYFAEIRKDGKYNLIDENGNFLSNIWSDMPIIMVRGFGEIEKDGKYNFIRNDGQLVSEIWFDSIRNGFYEGNGFAAVIINDKWNLLSQEGRLISNRWFDYITTVDKNGIAKFSYVINGEKKENLINTNGEILCKQWFDQIIRYIDGTIEGQLNGKWFSIDKNGNIINEINESLIRKVLKESLKKYIKH